ncbi:MAG: cytochrome C biogenesis protein CcmE [Sulfobacillus thermosulfidooxidans]|uniref:cytochrome c maturation protein CcmE n=1 Tax=Sulfobacillus TaxID=28033 RepID=UPI000CD17701|nr:cytochrome c maturation protein CcmE [Sulfobacillus sp. hq2]POB10683.1 cytochrome C biogenesis protein CcmE [Sulfobacillus sp. hq2]PSR36490.1 MAG: cytochrome C biogenesis protein CcmE [Sulfobacillus thermosulfidooxidans]
MTKKLRMQIGTFVILGALAYLGFQGAHNFSNYFVTVSQYRHQMRRLAGMDVRVQGTLSAQSVHYNAATSTLRFSLVSNGESLPILYHGAMPNEHFKNASAIVKGEMDSHGVFVAQKLEIQCPDHYAPAPNATTEQ